MRHSSRRSWPGFCNLSWQDGVNLTLDVRWAGSEADGFNRGAAELLALNPVAVLASASAAVTALRALTRTTPIVFANVTDPVGQNFVESLAHPGGNLTGFTNYEAAMSSKWLSLLKEIAPEVVHVAVMFNPQLSPQALPLLRAIAAAAPNVGVSTVMAQVHNDPEIVSAVEVFARSHQGGLVVLPDVFAIAHAKQIIEATARYRLPAIYPHETATAEGGLDFLRQRSEGHVPEVRRLYRPHPEGRQAC